MVTESVNNNTLVIKEPEEETVEEEKIEETVSEVTIEKENSEPESKINEDKLVKKVVAVDDTASIETLLSAYFQSEIEEYLDIFTKKIEILKSGL